MIIDGYYILKDSYIIMFQETGIFQKIITIRNRQTLRGGQCQKKLNIIAQSVGCLIKQHENVNVHEYLLKQLAIVTNQKNQKIQNKQYHKLLLNNLLQQQQVSLQKVKALSLEKSAIKESDAYFYKYKANHYGNSYSFLKTSKSNYFIINNPLILPVSSNNISVIFSRFSLQSILQYADICLHYHTTIKIVTTIDLWQIYILPTLSILFQAGQSIIQSIWRYSNNLQLYKSQQMYELTDDIFISFKQNFWPTICHDLVLRINDKKYIIEDKGIRDDEIIYGAWRRDIICEKQYCKYIDKVLRNNSVKLVSVFCENIEQDKYFYFNQTVKPHKLQQIDKQNMFSTKQIFYTFDYCELFTFLPAPLIMELFTAGTVTKHNKNSTVYKQKSTKLKQRSFCIIMYGQCVNNNQQILHKGKYFNIGDIVGYQNGQMLGDSRNCQVVQVRSQVCLLYSLDIRTMRFILGHYYNVLVEIQKMCIDSELIIKIKQQLRQNKIELSQWLIKSIIYDERSHRNSSQHEDFSRKLLIQQKQIKISIDFWRRLIEQNFYFIFLTKMEKKPSLLDRY